MKTYILVILILLAIIGFFTLVILIYFAIIGNKNSGAFKKIWFNTLKCYPDIECPTTITDFSVPEEISEEYSPDVARYCADLIVRLEKAANHKEQIIEPKNIQNEEILYNIDEKSPFGVVWKYNPTQQEDNNILFIAFRGTIKIEEWFQDVQYSQKQFIQPKKTTDLNQQKAMFLRNIEDQPMLHSGFLEVYLNFSEKLLSTIKELKPKQIIITGHSLGAAIASICALNLKILNYNCITYTFASPRIGDMNLSNFINKEKITIYNIINTLDIIPTLPPAVSPNFTDENNPHMYSDYGIPMRFSDNWKSNINNHLMAVYISNIK